MNAPETQTRYGAVDPVEEGRFAVLQRFRIEDIQHLGPQDLLFAQKLSGHGDLWGRWQTPKSLAPNILSSAQRDIDLARRLRNFLAKEEPAVVSLEPLVDMGVLVLTRLALLMRLVPSGGDGARQGCSSQTKHYYNDSLFALAANYRSGNSTQSGSSCRNWLVTMSN